MKLDIKTAQNIAKSESGHAFAKFLATTIAELDSVKGIDTSNPTSATIEVEARKLAQQKLREILDTLLIAQTSNEIEGVDHSEYGM